MDDSVLALDGYAEGFLSKQGGLVKSWKKRYFVFQEGKLSYRKDRRESSKVLGGDDIVDAVFSDEVKHGLCITLRSGRLLQVIAPDDEQATIWYDVFDEYLRKKQKA